MFKKYGLFIFPILFLLFIRFGLNFNGLYGQDAYEYLRYAGRLRDFFSTGISPGDYFWPVGFPLYGALLSFITQDVSFALQLISTLALTGTIWYGKKILELLFPGQNGKYFYLSIFLLLSPFLLRSAVICMSDAGALFFVTAFFYHAFQFRKNGNRIHIPLLFFFAANAIMFRYISILLLLIPALFLLPRISKKKHLVFIFLGVVIFSIVILPHVLIRCADPMAFLGHEWLTSWSFANYFQSSFATTDGLSSGILPNILFSLLGLFHPGNFIFGIPALVLLFRQRPFIWEEKILLASVLLYVLFFAGTPIQNLRFFLLPLPLLVIASFRGFHFLFEKIKLSWRPAIFLLAIVFQATLFVYGFRLMYKRNRLENSIAEWIVQNTKQKIIYGFDMDVSLKANVGDRLINNLWEKKYDVFEKNSLVLFNVPAIEKQWKGKNPMLNWGELNKDYQLELLKSFPEGWNLYEIK